jgi:hypothetical protein
LSNLAVLKVEAYLPFPHSDPQRRNVRTLISRGQESHAWKFHESDLRLWSSTAQARKQCE